MAAGPAPVLYLHSSSGRYGADRQQLALATGLDPARYQPLVIVPSAGALVEDLRAAGIKTRTEPLAVLRRALFAPVPITAVWVRALADGVRLARLIRAADVRLVHSNTSVILSGVFASRLAGVPHVISVREIYADFVRWWPYYRRFLLSADALCCSSQATRAQFGSDRRARVVHEAVTAVGRAERELARGALGIPRDSFVCAVLGRISSWKGQEVLAQALADPGLAAAGVIGLVAGDAWPGQERYEQSLRGLAADLGLGDRLRLVGFRSDPSEVYGAADVIVVPSTRPDPLPNAALEAAASGCCVVAAAHGGLPEIVRERETGRLFEPGDANALAGVLDELRQDPSQVERLAATAAADAGQRFSRERLLSVTHALYDELLAAREG